MQKIEKIVDELKVYGADVVGIGERFVGDFDLYVDCLSEYIIDPNFDILGRAILSEKFEEAFDAAHSLKGVSVNMGLTPIYVAICDIVEDLRSHKYNDLVDKYALVMKHRLHIKKMFDGEF